MCTLVLLHRPDADWPLIVGANRDEQYGRTWEPPAAHWPERPEVVGGLDELGEGSWFGMNRYGLVAAVANRAGTLGPQAGRRSRGELVLEALEHADAEHAAQALADLEPRAYRAFNLFVGGPTAAYWVAHREDGSEHIEVNDMPAGVHLLTSGELDDPDDLRIARYRPRFEQAAVPDPEAGDWGEWETLLADTDPGDGPAEAAMNFAVNGFGTVCSHLAAVPRYPGHGPDPVFRFAPGAPHRVTYANIPVVR